MNLKRMRLNVREKNDPSALRWKGRAKQADNNYSEGVLKDRYASYDARVAEYRFATLQAFNHGILRNNSPVLDVGCRNPFDGLFKFLRSFGWGDPDTVRHPWESRYVGIDLEFGPEVDAEAQKDPYITLVEMDVDGRSLPFPPTPEHPIKQFACGFLIEVLEHIEDQDALLDEMKRTCATVFVIGANVHFKGYYGDVPGHLESLSEERFKDWGFQKTGYVNFNGRPSPRARLYPWDSGEVERSSEAWGVWLDARAEAMCLKERPERVFELSETKNIGRANAEVMAMRAALKEAGHSLEVVRREHG